MKSTIRDLAPDAFRRIARKRMKEFLAGIGGHDHPSRVLAAKRLAGCGSILDVGCGPGVFWHTLYKHTVPCPAYAGVDPVEEMFNAKDAPREVLQKAHAEKLPFSDKFFDGVLVRHVLEHLPNPYDALKEAARVCRRDLIVVFSQWPNNQARSLLTDTYLKAARWSHPRASLLGTIADEFGEVCGYRYHPGGEAAVLDVRTGRTLGPGAFTSIMKGPVLAPREEFWHLSRNPVATLAALEAATTLREPSDVPRDQS